MFFYTGAGLFKEENPIKCSQKFLKKSDDHDTPMKIKTVKPTQSVVEQLNTSIDSEEEFVSLSKTRRRKKQAVVSDEENSREAPATETGSGSEHVESSQDSQETQVMAKYSAIVENYSVHFLYILYIYSNSGPMVRHNAYRYIHLLFRIETWVLTTCRTRIFIPLYLDKGHC